ncbi:uncharacterized protein LOC111332124 isoform X2 [Stylophora pistillata]|uniref:uncharacterized protein LOC111332124 isoform X2 n=1 Tax=Stylophora pistillata TaxID=50429 RepID=UPI000C050258|nr:uncharacterized protein LOC111332124 isoform X2 [Stylophora pistillata]
MLEFTQHVYGFQRLALILGLLAVFTVYNVANDLHSNSCTGEQSTAKRNSFNFRKFGNETGLEDCVDLCCRNDACELAIFSRGFHCYGVSCDKPELCHKILDRLLMEDERQLQRNQRNAETTDFIRHTSQVTNPRCPKRFVPSFHVLLLPASTTREFHKLSQQSEDGGQCSAQCCRSRECLLSFIEGGECYGVTGLWADGRSTKSAREPTLGLEIAIIDRNKEVSRSLDDGDEDPDDIGSDDSDIKSSDVESSRPRPTEGDSNLQTSKASKISSTTRVTVAKAKESVFSNRIPTKGRTKHKAQVATLGHGQHLSNRSGPKHPKLFTTKRITKKGVPFHFKGVGKRTTPPVSQKRAFKLNSDSKSLTKQSSSAIKPSQRVSSPKCENVTKVKLKAKVWKAAATRQGTQRIETGRYSKRKHNVRHMKQTTETTTVIKPSSSSFKLSRNSGISFEIGEKKLDTHYEGSTTRLVEGTDQENSRDDEGSLSGSDSISGDQRYFGKDRVFSGHDAFSGESGFDHISRDRRYFGKEHESSGHDDFSGVGEDDVSGDLEDLSRNGNDLSKDGEDLMEYAKVPSEDGSVKHHLSDSDSSGYDIGFSGYAENSGGSKKDWSKNKVSSTEDGNGPYKINHSLKPKLHQGEDKNGNVARKKIDLIKDLEELGSDKDNSRVLGKQASKKVPKVPRVLASGTKKDQNTKKGRDERMKSKKVHFDLKSSGKIKNQSSSKISSKFQRSSLDGRNKSRIDANIGTGNVQTTFKHRLPKTRPTSPRLSQNKESYRNRIAQNEMLDVKASTVTVKLNPNTKKSYDKTELLTRKKVGKKRIRDGHRRSKIKSVKRTVKRTKPSERNPSGRLMKTKANVTDLGTRPLPIHGVRNVTNKHKLTTKRLKLNRNAANSPATQIIPKAMSSGKVRNVKSSSLRSKGKAKVTRTGDNATSHRPSTRDKSVKDQEKQVKLNGKSKSSSEKLMAKVGQVINQKKRKSLELGRFHESDRLQSKVKSLTDNDEKPTTLGNKTARRKITKSMIANVNSAIADTGDLMQYAHRKVSVGHKITQKITPGRNGSNAKGKMPQKTASSTKAMVRKDGHSMYKTSPKDTLQNKLLNVHRKPRVKHKKQNIMHGRRAPISHPPAKTSEKGVNKKESKVSTHQDLMLSSGEGSFSSKENRSFVSRITFSPHHSMYTLKKNSSWLSTKQRSNSNASDVKSTFLGHFVNDSGGINGIDFSVKSSEKHHKHNSKHRLTVDLDDLGDADFDIMMSNDIPHKEVPKKSKGKNHKHLSNSNKIYDDSRTEKKRKHNSHLNNEDDNARGSFHEHKDQSEATSKSKLHRHHHHSHKEGNKDRNEEDEERTSKDEDDHKNLERKLRHHHKHHDNTNAVEQKDDEDENHQHSAHKEHVHYKKKENNEEGGEDNREDRKHIGHHHAEQDESARSNDDRKMKHHRHHKHQGHDDIPKIKYDDNHWQGKVIPGRVKITYDKDKTKKRHHRHHKHNIQNDDDNFETRENHHKRKKSFKAHEMDSDSDDNTSNRKLLKHFKENARVRESDDDDETGEKRTSDRGNTHKKHVAEKEESAEEKTDVNYEEVIKSRHRASHDEDDNDHSDESSESQREGKGDNDERQDNDKVNEEDKGDEDDHGDYRENKKNNRVVVGDDSGGDEEEEDKQTEESHDEDRYWIKHNHHEQEGASNKEEDHENRNHKEYHKPHFHHEHWESEHRHHESHLESKARDDDSSDHFGGEVQNNFKHRRRNFRKSKIFHRERKKEWRQHHEAEDGNEETENDNQERNFESSHKEHHYHYKRPDWKNDKEAEEYKEHDEQKETYERDPFRNNEEDNVRNHEHINEQIPDYEKEREDSEDSRSRDRMEERRPNEESGEHKHKHYYHEKFHHFPQDDGATWKNEGDFEGGKYEKGDVPHRHEQVYNHRLLDENEKPQEDNRDHDVHYFHGPKHKPRPWEKWHRKNRHHSYEKVDPEFEGTGGPFDSSAWMRVYSSDNDDYDQYYGGEGNQEYHGRKHSKHKHRKHRQSYEYLGYGNQNPSYYDYNYQNSRAPLGYYKPRSEFRSYYEWRKEHYRDYDRWKPKPSRWYPNNEHWYRKSSWAPLQEKRPADVQWKKFYENNGILPIPTPYPEDPSNRGRPTNPQWKPHDQTQNSFGENNWSSDHYPGQGDRGSEDQNQEQYNDWSKNGLPLPLKQGGYRPQQNPAVPESQPWRNINTSKHGDGQQSTGVQSQYVPPAPQNYNGIVNRTKFRPTIRRQNPAGSSPQLSGPTSINQIKNIMDKLNTPPSTANVQQTKAAPPVKQGRLRNATINKDGVPKTNLTTTDQWKDRNRLNGFFKEENNGKKKSEILRPANRSEDQQAENNSSSRGNASQHAHLTPQTTNLPPKPPSNQVKNKTTEGHTNPPHAAGNQTNKPTAPIRKSSPTTAKSTSQTTTENTPAAPNFGDVSQSDDSSETGKKHRKHRAPICMAGKTTDDVTLLRGKKAGNFTNIGDVGDFEMCIKRCCQTKTCDLAFKSAETCFLVDCLNKESCKTTESLDDIFSPRMCFVKRHLSDDEKDDQGQDGEDEWDDKVSPSGIREVCNVEKALGIFWKKTIAGRFSAHPCPRGAKGFVRRRCEADSRWLPPDFSDCVSNDYQDLYDKSRKLAVGADPSPLIRELSQLTTQNIDNSLIFGGDLTRATDIMAAIVQHNGQTEFLEMTREDVENFVRASSNLLDMTNQQEWFNIQKNKPGSADVLRAMEMFALQAARRLSREDMAEPTITNNIVIKMDRKSAGDDGLTFPDFANPRINRWDARHDVIALPSSVFAQTTKDVSVATISFKSLPYLLPDSNVSTGLGPNSKVMSTVLHPHPQGKINPPVTIVLSHIKRKRGNPKCVFWDYALSPHRGGAWSSRGCWLAYNNHTHSICQCSHLSNFAVLMDLSSDEVSQKEQKRERTMALMWIGIPVLIVGVIGGLYMSFSWNRKTGMPSTVTRPSGALNEKTGLLGQRVVTSQVREEFPPSPTRDLYRALSPGYSPTGDLEWQDEFDFEVEPGDQGFKQMLLPKFQMLQNHLINEFYDSEKMETKTKKLLDTKIQQKPQITTISPVQPPSDQSNHSQKTKSQSTVIDLAQSERTLTRQIIEPKSHFTTDCVMRSQTFKTTRRQPYPVRKLRVRFADESPPRRNLTDEDKERFKRLQKMERRVFAQHLSRWTASSHLNLSE